MLLQIIGPVIIPRPWGGGGGGGFRGGTLDLAWGISRNWEPKSHCWKLWKDSEGGPLKLALEIKTYGCVCGGGGGGDREINQKLLGEDSSVT